MSEFEGQAFSIVFVGRQNPQILNHDFLLNNKILPIDTEPFKSIVCNSEMPFSGFVSTPILTNLKYGNISITVEESRYQIIDSNFKELSVSPIVQITKDYFSVLQYTPLQLGGINFNGVLQFANEEDKIKFDEKLGIDRASLSGYAGTEKVNIGLGFSFPWEAGVIEVQIRKPKETSLNASINYNYEFKNQNDIGKFLEHLSGFEQIYERFKELLTSLGVTLKNE